MNHKMLKSRALNVSISNANPTKRQATTIVTSTSRSASPAADPPTSTNGNIENAASPTSSTTSEHKPTATEVRSRTVALLNVPDTVNDARIRALAEPYGALVKVVLRPDHQGAIIEYKEISSAGKSALSLDGHEIAPGRFLRVASIGELLHSKAETKNDRNGPLGPKKENSTMKAFQPTAPVRRPNQPGPRRGGRGGLGFKKVDPGPSEPKDGKDNATPGREDEELPNGNVAENGVGKPKSNADFKALFLKA